ncbi:MAG: ferritin family protein [Deltaproteobacteria bacterium]|nr:ferritin family protein [Deltaproteobacteria bacterium]
MKQWNNIDDVLDFAINEEEAAAAFYTSLAKRADHPSMREVFEGFALEEKGHKAKLQAVKAGEDVVGAKDQVLDLKVGDYLVDVEPSPDLSYQDALIVAMKKEKAAFKLYQDLAALVQDDKIKKVFLALAQEEAKHKLRFEVEYDDLLTED